MSDTENTEKPAGLTQEQMQLLVTHRMATMTANLVANMAASVPAEVENGPLRAAEGALVGTLIGLHSVIDKNRTTAEDMAVILDLLVSLARKQWAKLEAEGSSVYQRVDLAEDTANLLRMEPKGSA